MFEKLENCYGKNKLSTRPTDSRVAKLRYYLDKPIHTPVLMAFEKKGGGFFLTPGVVDMTGTKGYDEEIFGPIVQLYRVSHLDEAISLANDTQYGLTAALVSDSNKEWNRFFTEIEAGIINWNTPTTGALAIQPFGGLKRSGNGRPGAYYMCDALSAPVASLISQYPKIPDSLQEHLIRE